MLRTYLHIESKAQFFTFIYSMPDILFGQELIIFSFKKASESVFIKYKQRTYCFRLSICQGAFKHKVRSILMRRGELIFMKHAVTLGA